MEILVELHVLLRRIQFIAHLRLQGECGDEREPRPAIA